MKRYDLDLGKKRARKKLREFIKKRIFNRKDAQVLCLPGVFGTEIEDVYRKLGFKDPNIIGLERDVAAIPRLSERYPEVNILNASVSDFATSYTGRPFDVVSVDYCGLASDDKIIPVLDLVRRGYISDRCVVHINVMAGREGKDLQSNMFAAAAARQKELEKPEFHGTTLAGLEAAVAALGATTHTHESSLHDARDGFLSSCLVKFVTAASQLPVCLERGLLNLLFEVFADKDLVLNADLYLGPSWLANALGIKAATLISPEIESMLRRGFKVPVTREWLCTRLVQAWIDQRCQCLYPTAMERYSYVSESGRRMMTDLVEYRSMRREARSIHPGLDVLIDDNGYPGVALNPGVETFTSEFDYVAFLGRTVADITAVVRRQHWVCWDALPTRIDLGGGRAILTEDQVKEKLIRLIHAGKTNTQILKKFPTTSKRTLAALRAHVTMGSYVTS